MDPNGNGGVLINNTLYELYDWETIEPYYDIWCEENWEECYGDYDYSDEDWDEEDWDAWDDEDWEDD